MQPVVILAVSDSFKDYGNTKWPITKIMAKAKLYQDFALFDSATDTQYNASHAGATTTHPDSLEGCELYGSHAFEMTGFQSWYPETYDGDY